MSLWLSWISEETLSTQIFWDIQRKANYARAVQECEISHQMFVMMTKKIIRCNVNPGIFRTPSNIKDKVFLSKQLTAESR